MQNHHRLIAKFLDTHKNVMLAYLQSQNGDVTAVAPTPVLDRVAVPAIPAAPPVPAPMLAPPVAAAESVPAPSAIVVQPPVVVEPVAQPAVAAAPPAVTTVVVMKRLVALVSERTGYPEDMLGVDLDLEADLGVDSIKRVEILSALQNESSL